MKKLILSSAVVASIFFIGCANNTAEKKETNKVSNKVVKVTGIRKSNPNNESENLPTLQYTNTPPMPGQVKPFKKSYVTAPPMIPHSTKGMTPIKEGHNACLGCHMPAMAKTMHITPIPESHFVDNFEGDKKTHKIAGSRYFCTTCHAPQAKLDPVIENRFESLKASQGL
jgi:cytochrome c-type protein NapB